MEQMYFPIKERGFNLLDLKLYDASIKIVWFDKALHNPGFFWVTFLENSLKVSLKEFMCLNVHSTHLPLLYKNKIPTFFHSVLKHWCDVHYTPVGGHVG